MENLKNGMQIKDLDESVIYKKSADDFIVTDTMNFLSDNYTIIELANTNFEILSEEDEEIDIQKDLRELLLKQLTEREHTNADIYMLGEQINVLTRVVKQLDKKIKEKE